MLARLSWVPGIHKFFWIPHLIADFELFNITGASRTPFHRTVWRHSPFQFLNTSPKIPCNLLLIFMLKTWLVKQKKKLLNLIHWLSFYGTQTTNSVPQSIYLCKYVECMEYLVYTILAASAFLYFLLSTRFSGPDMFRLKCFAKMAKFLLANIQYISMVYRERF